MDVKKHYKLYKAGKLWFTATIATVAVAGGLMLNSTKAAASTDQPQTTQNVQTNTLNVNGQGQQNNNAAGLTTQLNEQNNGSGNATGTDQGSNTDQGKDTADQPVVTHESATVNRTITINVPSADGKSTNPQTQTQTATYTRTVTTKKGSDGKSTTTATDWTSDKPLGAYKIPSQNKYVSYYTTSNSSEKVYATEIPAVDLTKLENQLKDKGTINMAYNVYYVPGTQQKTEKATNKDDAKEKDLWLKEQRTVNYTLDGNTYGSPTVNYVWFNRDRITTTTTTADGQTQTKVTYSDWKLADGSNAQYPSFVIKNVDGYHPELKGTNAGIQSIPAEAVKTPKNVNDGSDVKNIQKDANNTDIDIVYVSNVTDPINEGVNYSIKGNWAAIDALNVEKNGIHVVGWNATNDSFNRNYHYIFVLDYGQNPGPDSRTSSFKEVGRVLVQSGTLRPDVKAVHNVYNAGRSGFDVVVPVDYSLMKSGDKLAIMSRWTSDPLGNNDDADLYGNYYTIDYNTNAGHVDQFALQDGKIQVAGWHASNQALGKPYRFLILWDNTLGHEVERIAIGNTARPDVANAYPTILGANESGFSAAFNTANLDLTHSFRIISRYSTAKNGEGNNLDYWFPSSRLYNGSTQNLGNLDSFEVTDDGLHVAGWHANDVSQIEKNHFLILYDRTANKQVAAFAVPTTDRSDVAGAFPAIKTADKSGFDYTFNFKSDKNKDGFDPSLLDPTHQYSVVSRYSLTNEGNGDGVGHQDYWFNLAFDNTSNLAHLDQVETKDGKLNLAGWHATSKSFNYPHRYLILLDATMGNKEVARQEIDSVDRPDVANAYGSIYGSYQSGFKTSFDLNKLDLTHTYQLVSRYTSSKDGNSDYVDYWFTPFKLFNGNTENRGNLDSVNLTADGLHVTGWNAADISSVENHHFLILIDQTDSNKQLAQSQDKITNVNRPDVAKAFPEIKTAGQSGFDYTFAFKNGKDGQLDASLLNPDHQYSLVSRYSLTGDGNGDGAAHTDYLFNFSLPAKATSGTKADTKATERV